MVQMHAQAQVRFEDHGHDHTGYWGTPDSSIDWCERNYVVRQLVLQGGRWQCQVRHRGGVPQVTPYVAEFYNTISNVILLAVGLFGLRRCWTLGLEARFYAMSFCTLVVGFGSAAFHGTLRYHWQLMDE
jgi:hypothetical protein